MQRDKITGLVKEQITVKSHRSRIVIYSKVYDKIKTDQSGARSAYLRTNQVQEAPTYESIMIEYTVIEK